MDKKAKENKSLSRKRKAVFSAVFIITVFLLLEAVLRIFGIHPVPPAFSEFKDKDGTPSVRYNLNHLKPEFSKQKKPGTFRMMIAGGSSAVGFPYIPAPFTKASSSFGDRLEIMLEQSIPGLDVETIMLAKMSMCSAEVNEVIKEAVKYQPDLIIVYSGHNEFLALRKKTDPISTAIRDKINISRVGQLITTAVQLGYSAINAEEDNPGPGLEIKRPPYITEDDYEQVKNNYKKNMEDIVKTCKENDVEVVISTVASNLSDWPPALHAFPKGMSEAEKEKARGDYFNAEAVITTIASMLPDSSAEPHAFLKGLNKEKKKISQADYFNVEQLLLKDQKQNIISKLQTNSGARHTEEIYAKYAPATFINGRAKIFHSLYLSSFDSWAPRYDYDLSPRVLLPLSIKELKQSISEESRIILSHRAPPELNEIIREIVKSNNIYFLDSEKVITNLSEYPPGFNFFEDHCHPNLKGQQVLAEALFSLLKENDIPVPKQQWRSIKPWDEEEYSILRKIDNDYLFYVYQNMVIWNGLKKRLPERSCFVRDRIKLISSLHNDDPFPAFLGAIYELTYKDSTEESKKLSDWYKKDPDTIIKCSDKYFTDRIEIRDGKLLALLNKDPDTPPLQGLLKKGFFDKEKNNGEKEKSKRPLDYFNTVFDLTSD